MSSRLGYPKSRGFDHPPLHFAFFLLLREAFRRELSILFDLCLCTSESPPLALSVLLSFPLPNPVTLCCLTRPHAPQNLLS
jgi:hypothetical protein